MAVVMTQELTLVVMLPTGCNSADSARSCGWLPLMSIRMKVKVRGRLKEMKRKEFKSDCLLGIFILLILLHHISIFCICIISFWFFF